MKFMIFNANNFLKLRYKCSLVMKIRKLIFDLTIFNSGCRVICRFCTECQISASYPNRNHDVNSFKISGRFKYMYIYIKGVVA